MRRAPLSPRGGNSGIPESSYFRTHHFPGIDSGLDSCIGRPLQSLARQIPLLGMLSPFDQTRE